MYCGPVSDTLDQDTAAGAVYEPDPRWEWRLVQGLGVPDRWVKARCLHTDVVPVETLAGDVVAGLCLTCDGQLPPPRPDRAS